MDSAPYIGERSDEHRSVCVYALRPGMPKCGASASHHVRLMGDSHGEVALTTCEEHLSVAQRAGTFLQQHPHAGVCGLPSTIWLIEANVCTIEESGIEPSTGVATHREMASRS